MSRQYFSKDERAFYIKCGRYLGKNGVSAKVIYACEYQTDSIIGALYFDYKDGEGFLRNINITNSNYLNRGVGTAMLKGFEKYMKKVGVTKIFGLYVPNGVGKPITPHFYENNGYHIEDEFICKDLDLEENNTRIL